MKEDSKKLQRWLIQKIKTDYPEDIDLLLAVHGHSVNGDDHGEVFDFFIPAAERGYQLAETFIIDGIGHDLYPRSWERMTRNADLKEEQVFCLGNSEILYAKNEEAVKRYEELLSRMQKNLNNPEYVLSCALEQLDLAMNIYKTMVFEEKPHQILLGAGLIMYHLNHAVCYLNGTFLPQMNHLAKMESLKHLPDQFIAYEKMMLQTQISEELKQYSWHLIKRVRDFIAEFPVSASDVSNEPDFKNLADWYQELSLCWQRIYHFCNIGDYENAFDNAANLQGELNIMSSEFHLKEMQLLDAYQFNNLAQLSARAKELESYIVMQLSSHGIALNQYANIDEFLEAH